MANNVYIHIPFCRRKCNYCSFISFPNLDEKERYLEALKQEIKNKYKNEPLKTLYFGGGTPSLLNENEFAQVLSLFKFEPDCEITTELNPENITSDYLNNLKDIGINRISLGCQTFNDEVLKIIGRGHTAEQVKEVVRLAQRIGFENISLDFIYGLPNQTVNGFREDLTTAINLGVKHISLYGLKIEEGCYFYNHRPKNLPDEDLQAEMYLQAITTMTENNFSHYEVSNFAIEGYESQHNLNYWNNNSYYGFGVAAHGYLDGIRYSNPITIDKYIQNPITPQEQNILTEQEKLEEEIFLGLRKLKGINIEKINSSYGIDFEKKYKSVLKKYLDSGHLEKSQNGYRFTTDGVLVSNYILSDFLE